MANIGKQLARTRRELIGSAIADIAAKREAISFNEEKAILTGINTAMQCAHRVAAKWYVDPKTGAKIERNFGEVLALMHSELSEALEAHRKSLNDDKLPHRKGVEVELADCVIRIFDTAQALGLDLAGAIIEKTRYNATREDHSLKARRGKNGKRY